MEETSSGSSSTGRFCIGGPWWARVGTVIFLIAFLFIFTSYVAPDWIEVNPQRAPRDTTFRKLGLWMSCYTNLHDPYYYDPYLTSGFEGCRWIYYPVVSSYLDLRDFLLPSFIIPVQITYTLCFIAVLILFFMILIYMFRYNIKDVGTLPYLIVIGMMLQGAGLLGTISVIVFGALSGSRTWAHEWQYNDLSWAFGVAVAGVVLLHLAGVFFLIEAFCQYKKRRDGVSGGYDLSFTDELKRRFGAKEKGWRSPDDSRGQVSSGPRTFPIISQVGQAIASLPARVRESFSFRGDDKGGTSYLDPYPQQSGRERPGDGTYISARDYPNGAHAAERSASPSEDGELLHERGVPPMRHPEVPSSDESTDGMLAPIPHPRSPPRTSPTDEDIPSEALGKILAKVGEPQSRPDSGISIQSPSLAEPPSPPKQFFSSTLFGKFKGNGSQKKGGKTRETKTKPNFEKIFKVSDEVSPQSSPDGRGSEEIIDLEELEGPPRVRRPSGNGPSQRERVVPITRDHYRHQEPLSISIQSLQREPKPPPLPSVPPPSRPRQEPLLAIQSVKPKGKPTSLTLRTGELPPPPSDSDEDNTATATLPLQDKYGPRSRAPLPPPTRDIPIQRLEEERPLRSPMSHIVDRQPGISSYQDFMYTTSTVSETMQREEVTEKRRKPIPPPPPPKSDYGLPSPDEYFQRAAPPKRVQERPPEIPPTESSAPRSAAQAVAEILASRQPLSLRIHIQKHKTTETYKKSQTFGPKKNGADFSESSI